MITAAETAAAGAWLLAPGAPWWDLVRYGPPGFEVYARVDFDEDDDTPARALQLLASRTATPDTACAAVWEGWGGRGQPQAPFLPVPHRRMLLFAAPVAELRDVAQTAWAAPFGVPPHLAWPADRAWCFACEVDEDFAFTVGCDRPTFEHLAQALPGGVREVGYGAAEPLWRD